MPVLYSRILARLLSSYYWFVCKVCGERAHADIILEGTRNSPSFGLGRFRGGGPPAYICYHVGMSRTSPIRLTRAAEADLAAIVELLSRDHPIPTARGDALRYALMLARGYMEHLAKQGQAFPTIEQLDDGGDPA